MVSRSSRLSAFAVALAILCTLANVTICADPVDWGYISSRGPMYWDLLRPEYKTCGTGQHQSPVNFAKQMATQANAPMARLAPFHNLGVENHGHDVKFTVPDSDPNRGNRTVTDKDGVIYQQAQFHFHTPAEHLIDRKLYEAELHMVHAAPGGKVAVVGLLVQAVDERTPEWDAAIAALPRTERDPAGTLASFDMQPVLTRALGGAWFTYSGSLTTPPCTEGVRWYVAATPIHMNRALLREIADRIGFSARLTQLNADVAGAVRPARHEDSFDVAAADLASPGSRTRQHSFQSTAVSRALPSVPLAAGFAALAYLAL